MDRIEAVSDETRALVLRRGACSTIAAAVCGKPLRHCLELAVLERNLGCEQPARPARSKRDEAYYD